MPYCPNCGNEVQSGVKFCPKCGTAQIPSAVPPSGDARSPSNQASRPPMVNFLSFTYLAVGLILAFLGMLALFGLTLSAAAVGFGLLLLLVAFVSLISGYALLNSKKWIRLSGLLTGVGYIIAGLLFAGSANLVLTVLAIVVVFLGAFTLVYLRLRRTQKYLGLAQKTA